MHTVECFIIDRNKNKLRFLYGRWNEFLCAADPEVLPVLLACLHVPFPPLACQFASISCLPVCLYLPFLTASCLPLFVSTCHSLPLASHSAPCLPLPTSVYSISPCLFCLLTASLHASFCLLSASAYLHLPFPSSSQPLCICFPLPTP